jgi:hypothetical protein
VSDVTPDAEDLKIITLARSTRARVAASEGAAVRDEAAALASDADMDPGDLAVVRDLGPDATIFHVGPDGSIRATLTP